MNEQMFDGRLSALNSSGLNFAKELAPIAAPTPTTPAIPDKKKVVLSAATVEHLKTRITAVSSVQPMSHRRELQITSLIGQIYVHTRPHNGTHTTPDELMINWDAGVHRVLSKMTKKHLKIAVDSLYGVDGQSFRYGGTADLSDKQIFARLIRRSIDYIPNIKGKWIKHCINHEMPYQPTPDEWKWFLSVYRQGNTCAHNVVSQMGGYLTRGWLANTTPFIEWCGNPNADVHHQIIETVLPKLSFTRKYDWRGNNVCQGMGWLLGLGKDGLGLLAVSEKLLAVCAQPRVDAVAAVKHAIGVGGDYTKEWSIWYLTKHRGARVYWTHPQWFTQSPVDAMRPELLYLAPEQATKVKSDLIQLEAIGIKVKPHELYGKVKRLGDHTRRHHRTDTNTRCIYTLISCGEVFNPQYANHQLLLGYHTVKGKLYWLVFVVTDNGCIVDIFDDPKLRVKHWDVCRRVFDGLLVETCALWENPKMRTDKTKIHTTRTKFFKEV